MLLALDVSNTTIKAGVFRGETLVADWRFATERHRLPDDYAMLLLTLFQTAGIAVNQITGAAISCVVPPLRSVFDALARQYLKVEPVLVGPETPSGVVLAVEHPSEVGADRIVNVAATHRLYGGPAIAVAFGTATVFDCVSAQGEYLGGAIAPGVVTALESLASSAAQLYQIDLVPPPRAMGRNTVHTMQSGLILGFAGLVEGLVARLRRELAPEDPPETVKVIATGGLAEIIAPHTEAIQVLDPWLTLRGLQIIHALNRP